MTENQDHEHNENIVVQEIPSEYIEITGTIVERVFKRLRLLPKDGDIIKIFKDGDQIIFCRRCPTAYLRSQERDGYRPCCQKRENRGRYPSISYLYRSMYWKEYQRQLEADADRERKETWGTGCKSEK